MLYGFTYDGRHSSEFNLTVTSVRRKLHAPIKPRLVSVPQKPGAYNYGKPEIGHLVFEVSVLFTAQNNKSFHDLRRDIIAWLYRDKEVELVFDEEPDKYYMAQFSEESDIDRLGTAGSTTLYFISSDPYAFGETKTQRIANPYVVFQREGVRYREDGTEVTENYPVYKPGKFDQAILIEEGTENLLPSASAPVQEEMTLSVGDDYYLSAVGGSATVEHMKHEALNLRLDKEGEGGQDFQHTDTTRNDFMAGTHQNTTIPNGSVTLARSGTDYDFTWDTKEEWEDPSNIRNNTGSADEYDDLDMIDLPQWNFIDHFEDYTDYWSQVGSGGQLLQRYTYVTIRGNVSRSFGIDIQNDPNIRVRFPATVALKYRNRGPQSARFIIEQGNGEGYIVELDDVSGNWVYLWMTIQNGTATIYKNGQLVGNVASTGASTINQMQLYIPGGRNADFDVDYLYVDWDYNKGAPPSNGWWEGTWETPWIDLSQVGVIEDTLLEWEYYYTHINIEDSEYSVKYQLRFNGVSQGFWAGLVNDPEDDGVISWHDFMSGELTKGDSASGVEIKLRVTLRTRDPSNWPYFEYLRLYVKSGYHKTGTYTSPAFDISMVGTVADSLLTGIRTVPSGTSVSVEVSIDGGAFTAASFGSPIPGISGTTPSTLQYRIKLSTTDVSIRPSLEEIAIQIMSQGTAYVPEKNFSLTAVDVSSIGIAADSIIEWRADTPASTSITIETSLDGSTWTQATNGGSFIPKGTDLTGKSVYIRGTLSTADNSVTPTLSYVTWRIAQQEPNRIRPATGTIVLTPNGVDRWQLERKPYATGWHAYGTTRDDESAYLLIGFNNEGTIEIWAYEDGRALPKDRYIFDAQDAISLRKGTDGNYYVKANGADVLTGIAPPPVGWHYWAVRWNDTTLDVFIDGEPAATYPLDNPLNFESTDRIFIGCTAGLLQWNGLLDDFRVSSGARSSEEISAVFNSGAPSPTDEQTDYKIEFNGSLKPTVNTSIEVAGTAPTQGVFKAVFVNGTSYFKISNGIEYVQIDTSFVPGDVLEIDCVREVVRKNGSRLEAMPFVHLDSDFFDLIPGGTIFVEPEGAAKVDATFTERWR